MYHLRLTVATQQIHHISISHPSIWKNRNQFGKLNITQTSLHTQTMDIAFIANKNKSQTLPLYLQKCLNELNTHYENSKPIYSIVKILLLDQNNVHTIAGKQ